MDALTLASDPYYRFGLSAVPVVPPSGGVAPAGLSAAVATSAMPEPPLWSPDHPMFWVAGLILVAVGAAGISGAVRVGPLKASASAGSS